MADNFKSKYIEPYEKIINLVFFDWMILHNLRDEKGTWGNTETPPSPEDIEALFISIVASVLTNDLIGQNVDDLLPFAPIMDHFQIIKETLRQIVTSAQQEISDFSYSCELDVQDYNYLNARKLCYDKFEQIKAKLIDLTEYEKKLLMWHPVSLMINESHLNSVTITRERGGTTVKSGAEYLTSEFYYEVIDGSCTSAMKDRDINFDKKSGTFKEEWKKFRQQNKQGHDNYKLLKDHMAKVFAARVEYAILGYIFEKMQKELYEGDFESLEPMGVPTTAAQEMPQVLTIDPAIRAVVGGHGLRARFRPDCLFLEYIDVFVGRHVAFLESLNERYYKNFVMLMGNPKTLHTKLLFNENINYLEKLDSSVLSLLVPKVKFYKIVYPGQYDEVDSKMAEYKNIPTNKLTDVEIPLWNHLDIGDLGDITEKKNYSSLVGIKDFYFERVGQTPAAVDVKILSSLTMRMQSLRDLEPADPKKPSILNLIVPPRGKLSTRNAFHDEFFRVKVVVGWNIPSNEALISAGVTDIQLVRRILNHSSTILWLSLSKHNLTLREDGTLELRVDFIDALESAMTDNRADLLYDFAFTQNIKTLEMAKDDAKLRRDAKLADDYNESIILLRKELRVRKYTSFMERLIKTGRLLAVRTTRSAVDAKRAGSVTAYAGDPASNYLANTRKNSSRQLTDWANVWYGGDFGLSGDIEIVPWSDVVAANVDSRIRQLGYAVRAGDNDQAKAEALKNFLSYKTVQEDPDGEYVKIFFVYFGDILEVALDTLFENMPYMKEEIRVLCGCVPFRDSYADKERYFNLADMPISLDLFINWFTKAIIDTNRTSYSMAEFFKTAISELIVNAYAMKCDKDYHQNRLRVNIYSVTAPKGQDVGEALIAESSDKTRKAYKKTGFIDISKMKSLALIESEAGTFNKDSSGLVQYLIINVANEAIKLSERKSKEDDEKKGIVTLSLGGNANMIKNITFTQTDLRYLQSAQLVAASGGDFERLRGVYNASVELVGNVMFKPGQIVYIDAGYMKDGTYGRQAGKKTAITKDLANILGISGYYLINRVKTEVADSVMTTSFTANWISTGEFPKDSGKVNKSPSSAGSGEKNLDFVNTFGLFPKGKISS